MAGTLPTTDTDLITALQAEISGRVVGPDHPDYEGLRLPWNLTVMHQQPQAVVVASSAEDIGATVRVAGRRGLGVAVQATGHGAVHPCDEAILLNTAEMRTVRVDPDRRTATVAAGARWQDVLSAAAGHGLAPQAGTSPHVGVAGFVLGGGYGWLSRRYGLAADSLLAATLVTADGQSRTVDDHQYPELLWALRGAGANFGVVTSMRIRLYPVSELWAGALIFHLDRAREVLAAYREWTASVPDEVSSLLAMIRLPEMLSSLAPLDGRLVQILVCDLGGAEAGAERLAALRALGPVIDTVGTIATDQIGDIAKDSVGPMPLNEHGHLIGELSPELLDVLLDTNGPDAPEGLPLLALRHLGGQITTAEVPSCYGHRDARFLINATGGDLGPELAAAVDQHHEALDARLKPHSVGGVGANFIGKARGGRAGDQARTRAAFALRDYQRLAALKRRYDPGNVFRFNHNIPPMSPGRRPPGPA